MAGKIQNEDIKSAAELVTAGGTAAQLPNDTKIWVTANGLAKSLYQAIVDGDLAGGGASSSFWTGYHGPDSSWTMSGTSIIDPSGDSTSTFAEKLNVGFGTVSSALSSGNKIPGIVFTPAAVGYYLVQVTFPAAQNLANAISYLRLTDGSTVIAEQQFTTNVGGYRYPICLTGIYYASSTSSKTIKIQAGNSSGGSTTIDGGATVNEMVEWTLVKVGGVATGRYSWTGYNDRSVSNWNFNSSGSFADPSSNTNNGNDVTQVDNNGFGTVTQYASGSRRLPGITFTPPAIGRYRITATIPLILGPGAGAVLLLRLTDGTVVYSEGGVLSAASAVPTTLTGIINVTSLSSMTLKIQGQVTSGSGVITEGGFGQGMLYWAIEAI